MPIDKSDLSSRTRVEAKTYELIKPQTISYRDRDHWSRIRLVGLQRVRAAGAIASDEHDNLGHGTGSQACKW